MPESEADSHETGSTLDTQTTSSSGIPLARLPTRPLRKNEHDLILPQLPSHKFRYSVWHDLKLVHLKGNELHAPRVRNGPPEKERTVLDMSKENDDGPIRHSLKGKDRENYVVQHENWMASETLNLSFQDLEDKFQRNNFHRILDSAQNVKALILVNNGMVSVQKHRFPSCVSLDVNNNFLESFKAFPVTDNIQYISATYNAIKTLDYLDRYKASPLQELNLYGNPVTFEVNYRQSVFATLPNLQVLDKIARTPADFIFSDTSDLIDPSADKGCIIL